MPFTDWFRGYRESCLTRKQAEKAEDKKEPTRQELCMLQLNNVEVVYDRTILVLRAVSL